MAECNTSSNKYTYTPYKHTTDEILWVGGEIECLGVCNNMKLTTLQTKVANKVCELYDQLDLTDINFQCDALKDLFPNPENKTLHEFIDFLLQQYCNQLVINESVQTQFQSINPTFTLEYCCCNESSGCGDEVTLVLSSHLQKIITCLCEQANRIAALETALVNVPTQQQITDLNNRIDCLRGALIVFSAQNSAAVTDFVSLDLTGCN